MRLAPTAVIVLALAACGSSPGAPAPAGLPRFYSVPAGVSAAAPGTLLKWQRVHIAGLEGTSYRVMYVSRDVDGRSTAVTGVVMVPPTRPPRGGFRVVSWAHGTNGMAPGCAPSLDPSARLPPVSVLNAALALGWEVVATDYQGEGTPPDILPYLVGDVAAYDTLDIVRAAEELPEAHAGRRYVVWGYSEGGQAALFAWRLAATADRADGLHLVGVVAGAPPSHLTDRLAALLPGPNRVFLYQVAIGFNAAYGAERAPLVQVLTPLGRSLAPVAHHECLSGLSAVLDRYSPQQVFVPRPLPSKTWRPLVERNDPATFSSASGVPLLLVQGTGDAVVDPGATAALARHLCGLGAHVEGWWYPGQNHGTTLPVSTPDVARWIAAVFEGHGFTAYQPVGEPGAEKTSCAP